MESEGVRTSRTEDENVLVKGVLAELSTDTRLLEATEGNILVQLVDAVDLKIA